MQDSNWIESEKITAGHAWRRWAARMIDSFFFLFLYVISLGTLLALGIYLSHLLGDKIDLLNLEDYRARLSGFLARYFMNTGYIHTLIKYSILYLIALFIELLFRLGYAACQACFGNTPGKQLFGIKIIDTSGRSINFQKAFKREMLVLFKGQGLYISIIYLFAMYRGYKNLKKHKITTWDKQMHLTVSYRIQSLWVRLVGVIILIVSIILIFPLSCLFFILLFGCVFFIWFILI